MIIEAILKLYFVKKKVKSVSRARGCSQRGRKVWSFFLFFYEKNHFFLRGKYSPRKSVFLDDEFLSHHLAKNRQEV